MKAATLSGIRKVEMIDVPTPEPGPGEALVKVTAVGVCGSDVHYYIDGKIGDQVVQFPQVIGHEVAGRIAGLGPDTEAPFAEGDLVAIEPGISCGKCEHCLTGRPNTCPNVIFYGTPPVDGAFCEYLVHPVEYLFKAPPGVSDIEAAMTEPLGIGIHAVRIGKIVIGDTVAILGAGTIGLCTMMAAVAAGARQILVTDLLQNRLDMAADLGATATFKATEGDSEAVLEWIAAQTDGRGVDAVFECAGQAETMAQTVPAARIGGRAVLVGICAEDEVAFELHLARRRELEMLNVRRAMFTIPTSLDLICQKRIDVASIVTHEFKLDQLAEALDTVHERRDGVVKAVVVV